ncbi:MAG: Hsp20/alpha crystallin family protein [Ardenticatenaceae bacterium]|nr:Hsp20/alpha crystallin family protein [Ardenticatenaceae bacterium]
MSTLIRWNPVREMMDLRREFDRLFESALDMPAFGGESVATWGLALDLVEKDDAYIVKASVPGIDPDDLEITLSENTLSIGGEFKEDKEIDENQYRMRERRTGSFCRSVTLPSQVNREAIEANYETGILTLHIPKAEEVKPKRIAIQIPKERKTLEG